MSVLEEDEAAPSGLDDGAEEVEEVEAPPGKVAREAAPRTTGTGSFEAGPSSKAGHSRPPSLVFFESSSSDEVVSSLILRQSMSHECGCNSFITLALSHSG